MSDRDFACECKRTIILILLIRHVQSSGRADVRGGQQVRCGLGGVRRQPRPGSVHYRHASRYRAAGVHRCRRLRFAADARGGVHVAAQAALQLLHVDVARSVHRRRPGRHGVCAGRRHRLGARVHHVQAATDARHQHGSAARGRRRSAADLRPAEEEHRLLAVRREASAVEHGHAARSHRSVRPRQRPAQRGACLRGAVRGARRHADQVRGDGRSIAQGHPHSAGEPGGPRLRGGGGAGVHGRPECR